MTDDLAERRELKAEIEQSVTVSFQNTGRPHGGREDGRGLDQSGKFVAEVAAEKREWNERS